MTDSEYIRRSHSFSMLPEADSDRGTYEATLSSAEEYVERTDLSRAEFDSLVADRLAAALRAEKTGENSGPVLGRVYRLDQYKVLMYSDAADCFDCGQNTAAMGEYYVVQDELWAKAAADLPTWGVLCVGCLESRLGRALTAIDFPRLPVNDDWELFPKSARIQDRIAA